MIIILYKKTYSLFSIRVNHVVLTSISFSARKPSSNCNLLFLINKWFDFEDHLSSTFYRLRLVGLWQECHPECIRKMEKMVTLLRWSCLCHLALLGTTCWEALLLVAEQLTKVLLHRNKKKVKYIFLLPYCPYCDHSVRYSL